MFGRGKSLLCIAGLLLNFCLVSAQERHDFEVGARDAAGQLAQHFPPLLGEVVDVQGDELYLSLGRQDQLLEGVRLNVFREGKELTSPSTGELLGRLEEELGKAAVIQVAETYAVANMVDSANEVEVRSGDKVRITSGRLTVGLLPAINHTGRDELSTALTDAVRDGLRATGRFHVVHTARLAIWLLERGLRPGDPLPADVVSDAAESLCLEYGVQPILRDAGDTRILELRLFPPSQPQTAVATAVTILSDAVVTAQGPSGSTSQDTEGTAAPTTRAISPPAAPTPAIPVSAEGLTTLESLLSASTVSLEKRYVPLAQFPIELRGFDAADVDGDGQTELVILSDTKVFLYHVQDTQLAPIASYSDRRPGILLSAQLVRFGDGQGTGVVVNRYSAKRRGMDSFFLVLQGRRLVRQQKGLSDILLVVDIDGDGVKESVWGQSFDGDDFFRPGQVRQYQLTNGRLKRQRKKVSLPGKFRATGAATARLGAQRARQLVFVDKRHGLQVYDGKTRRWTAPVDVGGSYVFATLNENKGPGLADHEQFDFEAIPAVADLDGDGIDEVLVPQNQLRLGVVPNLNLYSGGHVAMMRHTPQGYALSPVSPGFDGVVSGVAVLTGDIKGILVAVSRRDGVLRQRKQTVLYLNRL